MSSFSKAIHFAVALAVAVSAFGQPNPNNAQSNDKQKPAAETKYVELAFGNSFNLSLDREGALSARIGVKLQPDVDYGKLNVAVADVANGAGNHPTELQKEFAAHRDLTTAAAPAFIVAYYGRTLAPATYSVTLSVTQAGKPGAQSIAVEVKRLSAEIRPIPAQIIERIVPFPGFAPSVAPQELRVSSNAASAPLTNVSAEMVDPMTNGDHQSTGQLTITPAAATDTNGLAVMPMKVSGDIPNGKWKTNVRVLASEMATPVYVPFEIHTRYHDWLIVLAIVIGLALGWVVRVLLKGKIERANARLAVYDLIDKIDAQAATTNDKTFLGIASSVIASLQQSLSKEAKDIQDAVTAANTLIANAGNDLNQRLTQQAAAATTKSTFVVNRSFLPSTVAKVLETAETSVDAARKKLNERDADGALAALNDADRTLEGVRAPAHVWIDVVARRANGAVAMKPLPPEYDAPFKASIAKLKTQLDAIFANGPNTPVTQVVPAMQTAFDIAYNAIEQQEIAGLLPVTDSVIAELKKKGTDTAPIATAADALRNALHADTDGTLAALEPASKLLDAISDTMAAEAAAAGIDIADAAGAGNYVVAAKRLTASRTKLGDSAAQRPIIMLAPTTTPMEKQTGQTATAPMVSPMPPTTVPRQRTAKELFQATFWQFVIAAIGITAAGFIILQPNFDGTVRGLATAFFWGYALDITVDTLTTVAKKAAPGS